MQHKNLSALLPTLLPLAVAWAEERSAEIQRNGTGLGVTEIELAKTVGVSNPEKVKIMVAASITLPEDPAVREAAIVSGLLTPTVAGLTLGHSIYIRQGSESKRLLSHELRHVSQFERFGSISAFLAEYLRQVVNFGYALAPLEIDARSHEIHT